MSVYIWIYNVFSILSPYLCLSPALQKRQILVTVIEVCLPLLFAAILIALRHRVHSVSHPNATLYPTESVDDLPSFFSSRHASNPWELAYVPSNSSAVRSIAETVERALPINIRGERGWGCPFHPRNWRESLL